MIVDRPAWENALEILGAHRGEASELFVIDIAAERLDAVTSALAGLSEVGVEMIADEALNPPRALDEAMLARMRDRSERNLHVLCSARGTAEHVQIRLSMNDDPSLLDLELVFWNDLTFPPGLEVVEYSRRLERLVGLAERCRGGSPKSRCILATEHNGDPRELLAHPNAIVW